MQDFEIGQTVGTGLSLVRGRWSKLFEMNLWPMVGIATSMLPSFIVEYGALGTSFAALPLFIQILLIILPIISVSILVSAAAMNWQQFLVVGEEYEAIPEKRVKEARQIWWSTYGTYLLKQLQLYGIPLLLYLAFGALLYFGIINLANHWRYFAIGSAVVFFIMIPFFSRLSLVFPSIAACQHRLGFIDALELSVGKGWKIFFTSFLSSLTFMLLMIIPIIVLSIAIGLISVLFGSFSVVLISLITIVLYPIYYVAAAAVHGGVSALILIQLVPELNDRWLTLKVYEDLGGEPDTSTSLNSENSNTRLNTLHSYGRRKSK